MVRYEYLLKPGFPGTRVATRRPSSAPSLEIH